MDFACTHAQNGFQARARQVFDESECGERRKSLHRVCNFETYGNNFANLSKLKFSIFRSDWNWPWLECQPWSLSYFLLAPSNQEILIDSRLFSTPRPPNFFTVPKKSPSHWEGWLWRQGPWTSCKSLLSGKLLLCLNTNIIYFNCVQGVSLKEEPYLRWAFCFYPLVEFLKLAYNKCCNREIQWVHDFNPEVKLAIYYIKSVGSLNPRKSIFRYFSKC